MSGNLSGKVAIVTGSSRGIGRRIAERLGRDRASVVVNYSGSQPEANEVAKAIAAAGGRASAHKVSVLDKAGLTELAKSLDKQHGKIDILVNNAGYGQVVPLALMEETDWDEMIDTHVKGAFLATRGTRL